MRRQGLAAFGAVLVAGVLALAVLALTDDRSDAFTLGVRADSAVAKLRPGDEVCQRPVDAVEPFRRLELQLGTYGRPALPYAVAVRSATGDRSLARASVRGGYVDSFPQSIELSREVPAGQDVAVCISNRGAKPLGVYGSSDLSNRISSAYLNGEGTGFDLMLVFRYAEPKSTAELLPNIVSRASLFHGEWASSALYWVLLGLLLTGLAGLLALALRAALSASPEGE
jgi:hypothetical protein